MLHRVVSPDTPDASEWMDRMMKSINPINQVYSFPVIELCPTKAANKTAVWADPTFSPPQSTGHPILKKADLNMYTFALKDNRKKNVIFVTYLPITLSFHVFKPVTFKKFVAQEGSLSLEFFAPAPQNCHLDFFRKLYESLSFSESLHKTLGIGSSYCFLRRTFGCI